MNYLFDKMATSAADRVVNNAANFIPSQASFYNNQSNNQPNSQLSQKSNIDNTIKLSKDDATSIDSFTTVSTKTNTISPINFKLVIILFLIFIFIVSDIFNNTILSCFGDRAIKNRNPTGVGIIIQGIFLINENIFSCRN